MVIVGHGIVSVTMPESLPSHGLWPPQVSGVNLGVGDCSNAQQLVSPDHYPAHLKGVVIFH